MATHRVPRTADDLDDMPDDGQRYEIIRGELIVTPAPSPRHQHTAFLLAMRMYEYARTLGVMVYVAPVGVRASPDSQVEPDVLAVPRRSPGQTEVRWESMQALLLAVEVVSPSSVRTDRGTKRDLYMAEGVPEYWIVDADARVVEVWMSLEGPPRIHATMLEWRPVPGARALVIDLVALFREVHDED